VGESRAGHPAAERVGAGEAISISTGAMLPEGADAVLRVEDARSNGDGGVQALRAPAPGQDIRGAGEDISRGEAVFSPGTLIGPAELGVLASLGRSLLRCVRRPRLSVLVTGDELLGPREPPRPGTIRDTSSWSVAALARCGGAEVMSSGRARDEPAATREAIERALEEVEVAVVCGGVSVGSHDHVRPALAALGVRERFWGVALKPGAPAWFGTRGETLVFGLPGNPVSAMVTFVLLVGPALRAMLGREGHEGRVSAILDRDYEKPAGRAHAVRCRLRLERDGLHATPTGAQGSHVLSSMLGADGLAMIESERTIARAGERVPVECLRTWTRP
jgi:molybdopterin molybdotransferase